MLSEQDNAAYIKFDLTLKSVREMVLSGTWKPEGIYK